MTEIADISYSEWTELIEKVIAKGIVCDEMEHLKRVYPKSAGSSYDVIIYNQVAKLEERILKDTFNIFQKKMGECLEEADLEIAEMSFHKLKKHIKNCFFFMQVSDYPESVRSGMCEEIKKNADRFIDLFMKYLKKLEFEDNSLFIQDYVYICRKKLQRIKKLY